MSSFRRHATKGHSSRNFCCLPTHDSIKVPRGFGHSGLKNILYIPWSTRWKIISSIMHFFFMKEKKSYIHLLRREKRLHAQKIFLYENNFCITSHARCEIFYADASAKIFWCRRKKFVTSFSHRTLTTQHFTEDDENVNILSSVASVHDDPCWRIGRVLGGRPRTSKTSYLPPKTWARPQF